MGYGSVVPVSGFHLARAADTPQMLTPDLPQIAGTHQFAICVTHFATPLQTTPIESTVEFRADLDRALASTKRQTPDFLDTSLLGHDAVDIAEGIDTSTGHGAFGHVVSRRRPVCDPEGQQVSVAVHEFADRAVFGPDPCV